MTKTILVLAANPKNTPPLRLDQEIREIDNGLQRAQKRDEFILKQKLAVRSIDVRRAMLDYKPNIVHFCGHGSGEEGIAFEDENGKAKLVSTDALAGFFELFANTVECVMLNSCYSEVQAEAIAAHIPYVIGMSKAVGDAAAIEFAIAFYDALGAGENIEFAYMLACNAIQWAGLSEHQTPTLKRGRAIKNKDGQEGMNFQDSMRRSFDALISDKIRGFVGRKFIFDAIHEFMHTHDSGYFIIRGVPGIGKSALMAKLVKERAYIHHFNIASQNIRSTRFFLENISIQLIARYGLQRGELLSDGSNDSGFLMQCLTDAAMKRANHPIVLVIDALDEVDQTGLAPSVNLLYLPHSLPVGVYIIATTRPLDDLRLSVAHQQVFDLDANSESNLQDVCAYVKNYAQRETMQKNLSTWMVSTKQFVAILQEKSQGNFMYLHYVLPAIEQGKLLINNLDELPDGLVAYYQCHWRQMCASGKSEFDAVFEPIICVLGVAQEPVTVQQIAYWTKLSQGQVKASIKLWSEFLEEDQVGSDYRYRIYHASFQDFLKAQVDLGKYHGMIAEYYLALARSGR